MRPTRIRDTKMLQSSNLTSRVMETETISKNGASLKSQMSRNNDNLQFIKSKMKRIFLFLLIAFMFINGNSQTITQLNKFSGGNANKPFTSAPLIYHKSLLFNNDVFVRENWNEAKNQMEFSLYNEELSFLRTIELKNTTQTYEDPLTSFTLSRIIFLYEGGTDFINSSFPFTQTLFNDDEKMEFILTTYEFINDIDFIFSVQKKFDIVSEDGTILATIPNPFYEEDIAKGYSSNHNLSLYIFENNVYLCIQGGQEYVFYKINKNSQSSTVSVQKVQSMTAYPNPARTTITLSYLLKQGEKSVMNIYNLQGQLIEAKQIDYALDKIVLDVSGYKKGIYLYEVNGVSNRFIVN